MTEPYTTGAAKATPKTKATVAQAPATAKRRRPTLRDIAQQAGVSEAAASFAVNGKPGVSDETRARVQAVAEELGWTPSYAAKVLSGAASNTIGLVISRSAQAFGTESFFLRLMTGMQDVLSRRRYALLLQVIGSVSEEIETYRRWHTENRVDGVVLVDLMTSDPRPAALAEMGLPAILAGGPDPTGSIPSVSVDDAAAMRVIMNHLHETGRERVVYISGNRTLRHIDTRLTAFEESVTELGFAAGHSVSTDFSTAAGASATEAALKSGQLPDAMIFDNEVLTIAGLGVISRLGLTVPDDVAVVTWENTAVCEATNPTISALHRDPFSFGSDIAERLLEILEGGEVADYAEHVPGLIIRESTAKSTK